MKAGGDFWLLNSKQAGNLRRSLKRRANAVCEVDPDWYYDRCTVGLRPDVLRLDHYKETPFCGSSPVPVLCVCTLDSNKTVVHRHRMGYCPYRTGRYSKE